MAITAEAWNPGSKIQNRISRSDPVVHPSPRSSSARTGAVANPARPGDSDLLDTCTPSGGKDGCRWGK